MTLGGEDLYPGLVEKATALGFSIINNHPVRRREQARGHAALEAMLMLNGKELEVDVDDAEVEILAVAAGERTMEEFETWVRDHLVDLR